MSFHDLDSNPEAAISPSFAGCSKEENAEKVAVVEHDGEQKEPVHFGESGLSYFHESQFLSGRVLPCREHHVWSIDKNSIQYCHVSPALPISDIRGIT